MAAQIQAGDGPDAILVPATYDGRDRVLTRTFPEGNAGSGTDQSETWNAKIRPAHFLIFS